MSTSHPRLVGAFIALGVIGIIVLVLAGILAPETETYIMPSEGMEPTIAVGEELTTNLDVYEDEDPAIGDIVVFHPPEGADQGNQCGAPNPPDQPCSEPTPQPSQIKFIKRIVAGPGDSLAIERGVAIVNGAPLEEDYLTPCRIGGPCDLSDVITIPPDHYFVLGDNRGASDDSRFWGPIKRDWIIGRVDE